MSPFGSPNCVAPKNQPRLLREAAALLLDAAVVLANEPEVRKQEDEEYVHTTIVSWLEDQQVPRSRIYRAGKRARGDGLQDEIEEFRYETLGFGKFSVLDLLDARRFAVRVKEFPTRLPEWLEAACKRL